MLRASVCKYLHAYGTVWKRMMLPMLNRTMWPYYITKQVFCKSYDETDLWTPACPFWFVSAFWIFVCSALPDIISEIYTYWIQISHVHFHCIGVNGRPKRWENLHKTLLCKRCWLLSRGQQKSSINLQVIFIDTVWAICLLLQVIWSS